MDQPNIKRYFSKTGIDFLKEIQGQLPGIAQGAFEKSIEEALKRAYKAGYAQCEQDNDLEPEEE